MGKKKVLDGIFQSNRRRFKMTREEEVKELLVRLEDLVRRFYSEVNELYAYLFNFNIDTIEKEGKKNDRRKAAKS